MNKELESYIKTIIITVIITFILAFIPLIFHDFFYKFDPVLKEMNSEEELLGLKLMNLKRQEEKNKNDYNINIKLAQTYEKMGVLNLALEQYKIALKKTKNNPKIKLAMANLYLDLGNINEALFILNSINHEGKKGITYKKAEITQKAGDLLYKNENYNLSYLNYKLANNYYGSMGLVNKQINDKIFESGLKVVDYLVSILNIEKAHEVLEEIRYIYNKPIIDYKLSLIYYECDPEKALSYMEKVYKKDYNMINFTIYRSLLENLKVKALNKNDLLLYKLYSVKLDRLNRNIENLFVLDDDFSIIIEESKIKKLLSYINALIQIKIKNNTKCDYKNLYLTYEFIVNNKVIDEKTVNVIKNKDEPLKSGEFSRLIKIGKIFKVEKNPEEKNEYKIKLYIAKKVKSQKTLVGTIIISE